MKRLFILFFCVFSGATFGMMSAVVMAGKLGQSTALFVGAIIGGVVALLLSPLFVFATRDENIFAKLVICFVLSFPVAAVSGLTYSPQIGIGLTLFSILSTFYLLRKDDSSDERQLFRKRYIYFVPLLCMALGSTIAYFHDDLPDDAPSLIEMMGDNDMDRHLTAARKLTRKYGKAQLLTALQHRDPRVRNRAAHFLGLLKDPSVLDNLINVSKDPDPHVRMWVAFSLGEIGSQKALATLVELTSDDQEIVRMSAQEAIAKIHKAAN